MGVGEAGCSVVSVAALGRCEVEGGAVKGALLGRGC